MANPPSILNASLPQPNVPFLDGNSVSRPWFYFLLSLFNRTGGLTPIIPVTLQQQINALFVEVAMEDDAEAPFAPGRLIMADQMLADALPVRPTDPLLAAFFAMDPVDQPPAGTNSLTQQTKLIGAEVALSTGTPADICSVSLRPGKWLVSGNVFFDNNASTTVSLLSGWTSTISATSPAAPGNGARTDFLTQTSAAYASGLPSLTIGAQEIDLGASATAYLSARAVFGVSTLAAYGCLTAIPLNNRVLN